MYSLTSFLLFVLASTTAVFVTALSPTGTGTAPISTATSTPALPPCALPCIYKGLAASPCGSLSNLTCICTDVTFGCVTGGCELATCSTAESALLLPYVHALCAPVTSAPPEYVCPYINTTTPGYGNITGNGTTGGASNYTVGGATPTPSAFTGGAVKRIEMGVGMGGLVFVGGLMWWL